MSAATMTVPMPAELRELDARIEALTAEMTAVRDRLRAAPDRPTRRVGFRLDVAVRGVRNGAVALTETAADLARILGRSDCAAEWGACPSMATRFVVRVVSPGVRHRDAAAPGTTTGPGCRAASRLPTSSATAEVTNCGCAPATPSRLAPSWRATTPTSRSPDEEIGHDPATHLPGHAPSGVRDAR
jgi:hypothetical protein